MKISNLYVPNHVMDPVLAHFQNLRLLVAAAAFLLGPGLTAMTLAGPAAHMGAGSVELPPSVIRVNGLSMTRVSAGGGASCVHVTPAEAATALAMTNSVRAKQHLPPLVTHRKLQEAAAKHACEMANRGVMSHRGAAGTGPAARVKQLGYAPRLTAENIAAGRFDLTRVQQEWARSPGHLANILVKQAKHFGVGYAVAADGKTIYWAAVYANGR